jgi:hypothetical protein
MIYTNNNITPKLRISHWATLTHIYICNMIIQYCCPELCVGWRLQTSVVMCTKKLILIKLIMTKISNNTFLKWRNVWLILKDTESTRVNVYFMSTKWWGEIKGKVVINKWFMLTNTDKCFIVCLLGRSLNSITENYQEYWWKIPYHCMPQALIIQDINFWINDQTVTWIDLFVIETSCRWLHKINWLLKFHKEFSKM